MRTSTRIAGVLTGLTLSLGGVVLAAPTVQADIPACTQMAMQAGATDSGAVTAACSRGVVGDLQSCVTGLSGAGVAGGAATGACRAAAHEPR
ncbi:hypothetical protein ACWGDS_27605 [Streptomyces sp. NPDC055059]|jgi:hypothetical protein|uniref:Cysteine rich repeat-containing protein n=1 Tax=Streptomyces sp. NBC_00119 TaxID=2975659 RepID=A0AAU1TYZ2_9ACTN|nr:MULTISPECIES: hypothetical protein [unclassified Streptomyces]MCX4649178.1 hypothetical protein [Streptomyces sp. NBC_01446]MCX5322694.1 hypothetical protein [Streptomyces sp. NBC_00120]